MIYKRLLLVSSAFLLTLGFSGCGQNNSTNSDEIQVVTAAHLIMKIAKTLLRIVWIIPHLTKKRLLLN